MKKFLVASDSFKGTLTSVEIGDAFKREIPDAEIISISDGGEGFVDSILFNNKNFKKKVLETVDDLGNSVSVTIAIRNDEAFMDVASVVALNNYPLSHHLKKNSYGVGVILKVLEEDESIKTVHIGLGGSSTSDLGFYASLALGFKYFDKNNLLVKKLERAEKIVRVEKPNLKNNYIGLSDVENPLLGPEGALKVFGRQKGFTTKEISEYEVYFKKVAKLIDINKAQLKGAGAAGGLGYFIVGSLGGKIKSGIKEIMKISNFIDRASKADYIITGEGSFDNQSFYGKAPHEIALSASPKKTILVAGVINADKNKLQKTFLNWYELRKENQTTEEAIINTQKNLKDIVSKISKEY